MFSPEKTLFRESLKLSLSFLSSACATISAALPRGQRITGTVPGRRGGEGKGEERRGGKEREAKSYGSP